MGESKRDWEICGEEVFMYTGMRKQIKENSMHIILYVKTGCPWCSGVRDLLVSKHIPFEERNVTENKDFFDEMIKKSGQTLTPTLDIDGEILADSDAGQVTDFLRGKGIEI